MLMSSPKDRTNLFSISESTAATTLNPLIVKYRIEIDTKRRIWRAIRDDGVELDHGALDARVVTSPRALRCAA